jgi:hypothetical protein
MQVPARHSLRVPTPAASRGTHLLAAALLWSLVGTGLIAVGVHWVMASHAHHALLVLPLAGGIGWLKARLFLDRTARRIVRRIEERGDGRCLGGFLSWKSWLLVLCMILLGRALRLSPLPLLWRGGIYAAIGTALLVASRVVWRRRVRSS